MKKTIKNADIYEKAILGICANFPHTSLASAEEDVIQMNMQEMLKWAKIYDEHKQATYEELKMAFANFYS